MTHVEELLSIDNVLCEIAARRKSLSDTPELAEHADCEWRRIDEIRQSLRAKLVPAEDIEYEHARATAVIR